MQVRKNYIEKATQFRKKLKILLAGQEWKLQQTSRQWFVEPRKQKHEAWSCDLPEAKNISKSKKQELKRRKKSKESNKTIDMEGIKC